MLRCLESVSWPVVGRRLDRHDPDVEDVLLVNRFVRRVGGLVVCLRHGLRRSSSRRRIGEHDHDHVGD
jgi:hypothetical protein